MLSDFFLINFKIVKKNICFLDSMTAGKVICVLYCGSLSQA